MKTKNYVWAETKIFVKTVTSVKNNLYVYL